MLSTLNYLRLTAVKHSKQIKELCDQVRYSYLSSLLRRKYQEYDVELGFIILEKISLRS